MERFIVVERKCVNECNRSVDVVFREEHGDVEITKRFTKRVALAFVPGDVVCFTGTRKNLSLARTYKSPYKSYAVEGIIINKRIRSYDMCYNRLRYIVEVEDIKTRCSQMFELSEKAYKNIKSYNQIVGMTVPINKPIDVEKEDLYDIKVYPFLRVSGINTK